MHGIEGFVTATTTAQSVCARIAERLALQLGQWKVDLWFPKAAKLQYDENGSKLNLAVPSEFVARRIGKQFMGQIQVAAEGELGQSIELDIQIRPELFDAHPRTSPATTQAQQAMDQPAPVISRAVPSSISRPTRRPWNLRYKLDDFVVGPSNELAYAAATGLTDPSQDHHVGPLFVYGGCGLGKTHLLQGICNKILSQDHEAKVMYVTGEAFTNEFLTAVRTNKVDGFRRKMRRLEMLCIDDIDFIANKQATQQEFLHCFDALELAGSKVVLASDSHPKYIEQFSESLSSRCVKGMVVQVHEPDLATRNKIIAALASRRNMMLNEAAIQLIAARCIGSVREIEGALTRVHAMATLMQRNGQSGPVTIGPSLVNQTFASERQTRVNRIIHFDSIADVVCEQLAVDRNQINGPGRHRDIVLGRNIMVHLAREMTSMSYPEIARAIKRASHSSVVAAAKRMSEQLKKDESLIHPAAGTLMPITEIIERCRHAIYRAG
ncbi:MAG TPA: chromosomal replication initiator protein DnaA [Phycisphaerales bacterium]|nr:chromosomal replication initiator protein DnaA [Phycisphaerales bacterium]HCD33064.1 chromosomal replication initiator protein DnaA [Phycisphaerales bacterium]|tara:strand:- start:1396 stop:2880 length:1485 start_codon:yes stop_codon:yes gene_type:complete